MYTPEPQQLNQINRSFIYHAPHGDQPERYQQIRAMGGNMAMLLVSNCPQSRELALALTNLEQAVFWANAAIARNEERPADDRATVRS